MYIVTCYSFKGGVGRTMALVNVGLELARTGRRVLLVDFDLEAPSLETFNLPRPRKQTPGIVDYVTHYFATNKAPDAGEYIYESAGMGEGGGRLWIMPAGKQDEMYGQRLASIDWQRLYTEYDGYLMFEDLKAQWKELLDPNYVLIDSRTGHTDVGGICTRQLPDAVTILFFPNEQNLFGLKKVVSNIRKETQGPRKKNIQLHFVTSNIPDLDDEDLILENRMRSFRETLGYQALSGIIHRYDSLALLNQMIFTRDRPRSRLAQEYRELVRTIVQHNPEDREGVLDFLKDMARPTYRIQDISATVLEERFEAIRTSHAGDGEILSRLANIRYRQGRLEEALALINKAIDNGYRNTEILLRRAELYRFSGDLQHVRDDIRSVLDSTDVTYFDINLAIRLLRHLGSKELELVPDSQALKSLGFDERYQVALELLWSHDSLAAAETILRRLVQDQDISMAQYEKAVNELSVCLIGLRRFHDAMQVISTVRPDSLNLDIQKIFNYAMAEWAETGAIPRDLFKRVIDFDTRDAQTDKTPDSTRTPNYTQCLALAHWAVGDIEQARERISRARQQIMARHSPTFSAWRYLTVTVEEFIHDLEAMLEMINGKKVVPVFMAKSAKTKGERTSHDRSRKS
jgi:cellulose biosynthesis protein BcsQ